MTIPTVGLDENAPAGGEWKSSGDNRIREYKLQVREVLEVDHNFQSSGQDADAGKHKKVSLIEQADLGTGASGEPILGAETVNAKPELMYTDEDDTDVQITSAGNILLDSARQTNDSYVKAIDNAGTGTVELIKANTSDVPVIPDGAQLATSAAPTADADISNKKYVDDTVIASNLVQIVHSQTGAVATGTTAIPYDDTIPQITEGDEYLSVSITPNNTANILIIDVVLHQYNTVNFAVAALFQDSTANALACGLANDGGGTANPITFRHKMTAGTVSSTTFRVRAGGSSGTMTVNGVAGVRKYGGVLTSSITVTEVLP